jgi:hypothetical protein
MHRRTRGTRTGRARRFRHVALGFVDVLIMHREL